MTAEDQTPFDPAVLLTAVTALLLGEQPHLDRAEVAKLSGVSEDLARERWRSLGFPEVDDGVIAFTSADVEALKMTQKLVDMGYFKSGTEQAFIRTTGRTFARLAEWQSRATLDSIIDISGGAEPSLELLDELTQLGGDVQSYIWRRHLSTAVGRLLLTDSTDAEATPMCVGFADIVGYTALSRKMSTEELEAMVERFEQVTTELLADHRGRVVKTIGDEVLFIVDEPKDAALMALELLERHLADEDFPEVRIGMAYGNVLNRLGDVFGPVVNVASRLTSIARPGRAVLDRAMAESLRDDPALRIRRKRRTSVKGYEHLEPWSLKRPRDEDDPKPRPREAIEETLEDLATQVNDAVSAAVAVSESAGERTRRTRHHSTPAAKRRKPKDLP